MIEKIKKTEIITRVITDEIKLGTGSVTLEINLKEELFYQVLIRS